MNSSEFNWSSWKEAESVLEMVFAVGKRQLFYFVQHCFWDIFGQRWTQLSIQQPWQVVILPNSDKLPHIIWAVSQELQLGDFFLCIHILNSRFCCAVSQSDSEDKLNCLKRKSLSDPPLSLFTATVFTEAKRPEFRTSERGGDVWWVMWLYQQNELHFKSTMKWLINLPPFTAQILWWLKVKPLSVFEVSLDAWCIFIMAHCCK